jgi:hypothetical protein
MPRHTLAGGVLFYTVKDDTAPQHGVTERSATQRIEAKR